ncbi:MAG: CpsB/CapC family capsule biosynthesis tyrosine phosphatase, partial [Fusobacteriaceae bacterium]
IAGEKSKSIIKLLKSGYIDYLASDAHGTKRRSYNIEHELNWLKSIKGEEHEKEISTSGIFSNVFRNIFCEPRFGSNS